VIISRAGAFVLTVIRATRSPASIWAVRMHCAAQPASDARSPMPLSSAIVCGRSVRKVLERRLARPCESTALTLTAYSVSLSSPPTKATNTLRSSSLERSATMAPVVKPPVSPPPIAVRLRIGGEVGRGRGRRGNRREGEDEKNGGESAHGPPTAGWAGNYGRRQRTWYTDVKPDSKPRRAARR
jgi:hypothetical protein